MRDTQLKAGRRAKVRRAAGQTIEGLERRQLLSLVINPTFAANITSDPQAATIEATINRAIAAYQSFISDNVTVNITFQEGGGLGGSSGGLNYFIKYQDYYNALVSHETSATDTAAVASLPNQANDPVNNNSMIAVRAPLARALGFSAPTPSGDGTITLNTAICNLDRTSVQDSSHYDLQAVTSHEIDEILASGSALDGQVNGNATPTGMIEPLDLFRYSGNGTRSFDTLAATTSYLSVDGGATNLVGFNQFAPDTAHENDFGDWFSNNGAGNGGAGQTPRVQDSNGTPGSTPNLGVELTRLDALGFTLNALNAPGVTAGADQPAVEGAPTAIDLGKFTDPDAAPWGVTVSWGDGSPNTNYFLNGQGPLGSKSHTFVEEGTYTVKETVTDFTSQSSSKTFTVTVSDPAVIATGGMVLTPVEGQDSGTKTVATFTDPGGAEAVGNYSASIDWGDGSAPTTGTITPSGGGFIVSGHHTYAEESSAAHPGSDPYLINVTISHESALTATVTSQANVSDPAVIPSPVSINTVEGQDSGSVVVATFTDPGGPEVTGDYSATIDWGDGSAPTTGAITLSGVTFSVSGDHTYAEESTPDHTGTLNNYYQITVTVNHEAALAATTSGSKAFVSDPAVVPTGGFTFNAVEGVPSAVQTVATFTDPGGPEAVGDYSALIDWGDGTAPSAGTITQSGTTYTVTASHTFATGLGLPDDFGNTFCDAGVPSYHKPITVSISHEAAPIATTTSDAHISLAPASAHLAGGSLIVVATTGDDHVQITPVGNTGAVNVNLNSISLGSFTLGAGGRIIVAAMDGNDDIQVAGGVRLNTVLYGGPGNDRIKGGGGQNIEVGCEGNDDLTGGSQHDLLIGGTGSDNLNGTAGGDIIIAGEFVDSTLAEDDKFSDLVNALNGGPIHAINDASQDTLQGASGDDTLYYHFLGSGVTDIVHGKVENAINI